MTPDPPRTSNAPLAPGPAPALASPAPSDAHLARVLGPFDATCIVVGAIIGVGIFFTPRSVAQIAGSPGVALLAWMVGGVIALLGALTFAALGRMYPRTGGQYEILRDAYGRGVGFLFVFCNATAVQAGAIAIIAFICASNLALTLRSEPLDGRSLSTIATVLIVGLVAANCVGVRWGAGIQNATVVGKVGTLLVVVALAIWTPHAATPDAANPASAAAIAAPASAAAAAASSTLGTLGLLFMAMVPAFFSYGGWQHALWIGGEVRDAQRNVPLAIVVGVLIVVLVYVSAAWSFMHLLGYERVTQSGTLAADAVAVVWDDAGRRLVAGAVAVSAFGVLNAQLLSGPRLVYRMAIDGQFFTPFARTSDWFRTPVAAIALLGALGLALLWSAGPAGVDFVLTGVVFIDGAFFVLTGLALFVFWLRGRREAAAWSLGFPVAPLLFVVGEAGIVAGAYAAPTHRAASVIGLAWIAAALLVYLIWFRTAPQR